MRSLKRLLIVANLYHLSSRMPGIAKYLQEFGWHPTVLSPPVTRYMGSSLQEPDFVKKLRIMETPYRGDVFWFWRMLFKRMGYDTNESITEQLKDNIRKTSRRALIDVMMRWYQAIVAYPDTERNWKRPALKKADDVLGQEKFHAILSSSQAPICHIIAASLKKKYRLPWVADFRDPWTQNHNYPFGFIRKSVETRLEIRTLSGSDAIIAATPAYASKQRGLHNKSTMVVTNGFDHEYLNIPPAKLTAKFVVTYTGQIYRGKQDPGKFLQALRNLISRGVIDAEDIEVRFFGPRYHWLRDAIIDLGLSDTVGQYGTVPRDEAWTRQRESHVLLLLNWEDPAEKGVYPLKLFEYLSACRPILATGGIRGDDLEEILADTGAGEYAVTVDDIELSILRSYKKFKCAGGVPYQGDFRAIQRYSYRGMAERVAELLDEIVVGSRK
jgi:hypothetical protein